MSEDQNRPVDPERAAARERYLARRATFDSLTDEQLSAEREEQLRIVRATAAALRREAA